MDDDQCASRPLAQTLLTVATTYALFVLANWELGPLIQSEGPAPHFKGRCLAYSKHALIAVVFPTLPFQVTAWNVWCVWVMRRKLQEMKPELLKQLDWGTVAIMTLCPILIELPADHERQDYFWGTSSIIHDISKNVLELSPAATSPDQMIGDHVEGRNSHDGSAGSARQYLKLHPSLAETFCDRSEWMQDRLGLLASGLVPEFHKLRFLRSRTTFQVVVTGLQALGYILVVAQRWGQHSAKSVSPLEALVGFLCLHVILQLLMELIACSHYQHPLLLRLQPHHLLALKEQRRQDRAMDQFSFPRNRGTFIMAAAPALLSTVLMPAPLFCYALSIRHHCLSCSLSCFFLVFLPIFSVIWICIVPCNFVALFEFCLDDDLAEPSEGTLGDTVCIIMVAFSAFGCIVLVYLCSIVLAVVGTIQNWELFNTRICTTWMLPHVSA